MAIGEGKRSDRPIRRARASGVTTNLGAPAKAAKHGHKPPS